jgi:hypothetical protein
LGWLVVFALIVIPDCVAQSAAVGVPAGTLVLASHETHNVKAPILVYPAVGGTIKTADGGFALTYNNGLGKLGSDGSFQWHTNLSDGTNSLVNNFIQTNDAGYALSGADWDASGIGYGSIIKLDASGNVQWKKTFSGMLFAYFWSVVQTEDGGFLAVGYTSDQNNGGIWYVYLVKVDAAGNKQWENHFQFSPNDNSGQVGSQILMTGDGGFLLIGTSGSSYLSTVKISSNGDVLSQHLFSDIGISAKDTKVFPVNGGFLLSIYSEDQAMNWVTLNENGDLLWSKRMFGYWPFGLQNGGNIWSGYMNSWDTTDFVAADGGYYMLSQDYYYSPGLLKLSANFTPVWFQAIPSYERVILSAGNGTYKLGGWDSGTFNIDTFRDPMPGVVAFQSPLYNVSGGVGNISISLLRSGGVDGVVSVNFSMLDGSAIGGLDYLPVNGTVTFGDNVTVGNLTVTLLPRNLTDTNVSFTLALGNVSGGALLGAHNTTTVTISYLVTPTPIPTLSAQGVVTPSSIGNNSSLFQYPSVEKTVSTIFALVIGVLLAWFWPWLAKLLQFLYDAIKSYLQKQFSTKEAKYRGVTAKPKKSLLFGVSLVELFVGFACILLIGITFAYAKDYLLSVDKLLVIIVAAGITIVISEMVRRFTAHHYKAETEYKFWDAGAIILVITSLLHQPFSRPARTIINKPDELGARKQGIIAMAPCVASLLLSIIFLMLLAYGNGYEMLGREGFKMGMMLCVYSLMPFEPMDGMRVINWNKFAWAIVFLPALVFYLGMLLFVL